MTALAEAFIELRADDHLLRTDVTRAGSLAGQQSGSVFGKEFSRRAKRTVAIGGAAIFAGLTAGLRTGFGEIKDYEAGLAGLRQTIKSTGGVANVSTKDLEALASRIQSYSGQTDDSIVAAEKLLLTFKNVHDEQGRGNDIFTQATKITADMAQQFGGDASSKAIQLGKALNDPIKGIAALTRVGVSFTEGQKKTITSLVESGHVMGAQKIILKELGDEVGGQARAYGQTLPGKIDRTKRAYEDITQELATKLLPSAIEFTDWVRDDALPALEDFGGWVSDHRTELEWFGGLVGGLAVGFKAFKGVRSIQALVGKGPLAGGGGLLGGGAASIARPIPVFVTNQGFGGGVGGTGGTAGTGKAGKAAGFGVGALSLAASIASLSNVVKNQQNLPGNTSVKDRALDAVGSSMIFGKTSGELGSNKLPNGMVWIDQETGLAAKSIEALEKKLQHLEDVASRKTLSRYLTVQTREVADGADHARNRLNDLGMLLGQRIPVYTGAADDAMDKLLQTLAQASREAERSGREIGDGLGSGLIAGLYAQIPKVDQAAQLVISSTIKQMRLAADIESPSKKTAEIGKWLGEGLVEGWYSSKPFERLGKDTKAGLMKLHNDVQEAMSYRSGVKSGLTGFASLSGLGQQTDSFGNPMGGANVNAFLRGRVHKLRTFSHLLHRLKKLGAGDRLIAEFAQIGPDAIPAMRDLIAGGAGRIEVANRLERRISQYATAGARTATNSEFDDVLHRDLEKLPKRFARELRDELKHLRLYIDSRQSSRHHAQRVYNFGYRP